MVYAFELPPELMGKMVEIRTKTNIPLAQQVREAVRDYCEWNLGGTLLAY
jgi:predicted DNA-binding protein